MRTIFNKVPLWYTLFALLSSLSFVLFLGYADEGFNDWRWIHDAGSWVTMFIFWNVLFWVLVGVGVVFRMIFEANSFQDN